MEWAVRKADSMGEARSPFHDKCVSDFAASLRDCGIAVDEGAGVRVARSTIRFRQSGASY